LEWLERDNEIENVVPVIKPNETVRLLFVDLHFKLILYFLNNHNQLEPCENTPTI